ncbi:Transmembrane 9 superfamily member 4 [Geodia barretti]|uniref:Transmembrane 9 superfamily member n=1 Tax=Geodia barretti TaxID=519541 RepID=A0AA35TAI0_GEOBA|nr:Transmembrane 9 superfamily member 4 [Geodia barretti]
MFSMGLTDMQKIGLGLVAFGLGFLSLGVVLFFDKGLLAMGNHLVKEKKEKKSKKKALTTPPLTKERRTAVMGVAAATRVVCLSVLCLCVGVRGFYIPGVAPTEYEEGDKLEIKAVKMTSIKTQLPYEYYSLPFCKPKDGDVHYKTLNLGEVLRGDRIVNTPYQLSVLKDQYCMILCETELNHKQVKAFSQRIDEDYTLHMLADNLPAATVFKNLKSGELQYEDGFKLGFSYTSHVVINNHLKIRIKYHAVPKPDKNVYRIVGFEVEPQSIHSSAVSKQPDDRCIINKDDLKVMELKNSKEKRKLPLMFTYSVVWEERPELAWASRWDTYLSMSDVQIHWFAICNSVAIVLFLSGILALIIVRTLRRDIARYNKDEEAIS